MKKRTKIKLHKISFTTFVQSLYLTVSFFVKNDLYSYASACAFGFLFSFIPVMMLCIVFMLRFLHASPEIVMGLISKSETLSQFFNFQNTASNILNVESFSIFEVVTIVAIIMMARRFFSSAVNSMNCIFKNEVKSKGWLNQVIIFGGEAILVILISIITTAVFSLRSLQRWEVFEELRNSFPILIGTFSKTMINTVPSAIEFIIITLMYRETSRTRPPLFHTLVASTSCTFIFWAFQRLMNLFINVNRYNLVYGVLSNIVVLLLEVWFFFIIFLFCAQFLFVAQFFETLLMSELYLLPGRENMKLRNALKRIIFIQPDSLMLNKNNVLKLKKGDLIYSENDPGTDVYYVVKGTVLVYRINKNDYKDEGSFFGEQACMMNEIRIDTAVADTDVELLRVSDEKFYEILNKNPNVSRKALSQISNYFAKFYGLNSDNPL